MREITTGLPAGIPNTGVAYKRRSHRQQDLHAFNARRTELSNRGKAFLSDVMRRVESIRDGNEDIVTLHETLSSRTDALCAVRERLGVPTLDGQPCEYWGGHVFAKESNPITRHNGRHPYGSIIYAPSNTCLCRHAMTKRNQSTTPCLSCSQIYKFLTPCQGCLNLKQQAELLLFLAQAPNKCPGELL